MKNKTILICSIVCMLIPAVHASVTFTSKNGAEVTVTYGDFSHSSNANGPQDDLYANMAQSIADTEREAERLKKLALEFANNFVYKLDPKTNELYSCDRRNKSCYDSSDRSVSGITIAPNQLVWPQSAGILQGYFKAIVNKHESFIADENLQYASLEMMRDYTLPMMEILSLVKSKKGKSIANVQVNSAFLNGELGHDSTPAKVKKAQAKYLDIVSKMNWNMNHQFFVTDTVAVVVLAAEIIEKRAGGPLKGLDAVGPSRNDVVKLAEQIRKTRNPKWITYVENVLAPFFASVSRAGYTRDVQRMEVFRDYRFDTLKALQYKSFSNLKTLQKTSTQFVTLKLTKNK